MTNCLRLWQKALRMIGAEAIASLDVLQCLAERARTLNYCRPELTSSSGIAITEGRHPVVETVSEVSCRQRPNWMTSKRCLSLPAPIWGKRLQRQTALIVLLALRGSRVPARQPPSGP